MYLSLSIVDHVGALTNLSTIGAPIAFDEFSGDNNPFTAPIIQTLLDCLFLCLLLVPRFRVF